MDSKEFLKELDFIRNRLYETAQSLEHQRYVSAAFILGGLYECVREKCSVLKKEIEE